MATLSHKFTVEKNISEFRKMLLKNEDDITLSPQYIHNLVDLWNIYIKGNIKTNDQEVNSMILHAIVGSTQDDKFASIRIETEIATNRNLNINAIDGTGRTPLHIAARRNLKQTVNKLLDYGANPTIKSNSGKTALDDAQATEAHDVIEILSEIVAIAIYFFEDYQLELWWFLEEKSDKTTQESEHYYSTKEECRDHIREIYLQREEKLDLLIFDGGKRYYQKDKTPHKPNRKF